MKKSSSRIVVCCICGGTGLTEPKSARLMNRMPSLIVMVVLLVFYAYAVINLLYRLHFDQIFPVVGSLTSMIVAFYFSQRTHNK
jgi:hypothetical protein